MGAKGQRPAALDEVPARLRSEWDGPKLLASRSEREKCLNPMPYGFLDGKQVHSPAYQQEKDWLPFGSLAFPERHGKGPLPLDSPERSMSLSQRAASKLIDKTCVPHDGVSWLFCFATKTNHQEAKSQKGGTKQRLATKKGALPKAPKIGPLPLARLSFTPNSGSFQLRRPGAPHEGPELPRNETGKPLPNRTQLAYPSKISQEDIPTGGVVPKSLG